jgi:hypothetical protein
MLVFNDSIRLVKIAVLSILLFVIIPNNLFSQSRDSIKLLINKVQDLEKKVRDVDGKLGNTQIDVFNAFNQNIKTMVEDHEKNQKNFSLIYYIIYGFFTLIIVIFTIGTYLGFKSLKDLRDYTRERIEKIISAEVNEVHIKANDKLKELGIDGDFMMKDIKYIRENQLTLYRLSQLQSTDSQKEIAMNAIISGQGLKDELIQNKLIDLINERTKPYIKALACYAIISSDPLDSSLKNKAETILKQLSEGAGEERKAFENLTRRFENLKSL